MPSRRALLATTASTLAVVLLVPLAAGAEPGTGGFLSLPRVIGALATTNDPYDAISCPSASSCVAVGPGVPVLSGNSSNVKGFPTATTLAGGVWSAARRLPLPAGAGGSGSSLLLGLSCADAAHCTAVGAYKTSAATLPVIETEAGGTWSASTLASPAGAGVNSALDGLWCAAQGTCAAVGFYQASAVSILAMVSSESAGTWAAAASLASPSGTLLTVPTAVACSSTGNCVAVGEAVTGAGSALPFAWTEASGTWSAPVALPTLGGATFVPSGVACPTSTTCLVSGTVALGSLEVPAVGTDHAGAWSLHRLAFPRLSPRSTEGTLSSIACSSGTCVAVGSLSAKGTGPTGAAVTWNGGTWSSVDLVHGVRLGGEPALSTSLSGVACATATSCEAVGNASLGTTSTDNAFSTAIVPDRPVSAPSPPTGVVAAPLPHGVRVLWSPPVDDGGAPVTEFTATAHPSGRACSSTGPSCTIGGLADGHAVVVTVTVSNGVASSLSSAHAVAVPGSPPTPPRHIEVSSTKGVATVTWHASATPPGERVTRYDVTLAGGGGRTILTVAPRCRFGGLVKGHRYELTIVAFDATGASAPGRARFVAA